MLSSANYTTYLADANCCIGSQAALAIAANNIASVHAEDKYNNLRKSVFLLQVLQTYTVGGEDNCIDSVLAQTLMDALSPICGCSLPVKTADPTPVTPTVHGWRGTLVIDTSVGTYGPNFQWIEYFQESAYATDGPFGDMLSNLDSLVTSLPFYLGGVVSYTVTTVGSIDTYKFSWIGADRNTIYKDPIALVLTYDGGNNAPSMIWTYS